MRIVLTGGGTGGHIFPLVAVARELVAVAAARQEALRLVFLGPAREAKQALDAEGVVVRGIAAGKLRRYLSPYYLVDIPKIAFGMVQSCIYLWWYMPDAVFSKGGYGSFTTVLVAWLFRIPVYLHESDSVAGLSNRLLARFSRRIFVSFPGEYPEFSRDRIHLVGNPVRDMRGGAAANILEKLVLSDERPVVLVVGGSQGARQVNELMLEAAEELSAFVSIIHQTGEGNIAAVQKRAEQLSKRARQCYRPIAFLSEQDMRDAYAAAALVVSRAGSSVLFELALLKKPSILIPLMSAAAGHQEENARIYQAAGACALLNARTATPAELVTAVAGLVAAPKRLAQMGEAAGTFAKPQAAATIAQTILKI